MGLIDVLGALRAPADEDETGPIDDGEADTRTVGQIFNERKRGGDAEVTHDRGFLWDSVSIESSGGLKPLQVEGLPKAGAKRFVETAAGYGITLDEHTAQELVTTWRQANPHIVQFWWDLESAALRVATAADGAAVRVGCVELRKQRRAMVIRLPSGRDLFYQRVGSQLVKTASGKHRLQIIYEGINQYTRKWELLRAWPGKLAENAAQAVARDVLAHALQIFRQMNINVVGTVHDEVIAEVPASRAQVTLHVMLAVMCRAPIWASGLPVHAEGRVASRYGK